MAQDPLSDAQLLHRQRGYLKRVYGGGERAIGVSRDSYLKFIARRSGR